ncbi:MAG: class 1 fructose-bisphosphatase [Pseudorhodoplanes sp.]|nr:class 1 fructose-bisphosphatase [Pseudorhodoplanes sp.]
MSTDHTTLGQFLQDAPRHPPSGEELNAVIMDIARACAAIAGRIAQGALGGVLGATGQRNKQGEIQKKLDQLANDILLHYAALSGHLAGMVSEEMDAPVAAAHPRADARYLLVFDPLDGSSNIDVNVAIGSIFSILPASSQHRGAVPDDFLQPGERQLCAGYAIYGPSTMLVLSLGSGVDAFTLDPARGTFVLTHRGLRIESSACEFAINVSNSRFWELPVRRYVDDCLAGKSGPRGKDFNMRWIASLVAEAHRILMRGGVFLYPGDRKDAARAAGRLRLLFEANPIAFLIEQAGGRASSGREDILRITPADIHQRIPFVFGAKEEVDLIEDLHLDPQLAQHDAPLFGSRGLFRRTT